MSNVVSAENFYCDRKTSCCFTGHRNRDLPFQPRPFEQLQFIRGTENLMMDLMDPPPKMLAFLERMHNFYCELLEKWARTEVDGLGFMDEIGRASCRERV